MHPMWHALVGRAGSYGHAFGVRALLPVMSYMCVWLGILLTALIISKE